MSQQDWMLMRRIAAGEEEAVTELYERFETDCKPILEIAVRLSRVQIRLLEKRNILHARPRTTWS